MPSSGQSESCSVSRRRPPKRRQANSSSRAAKRRLSGRWSRARASANPSWSGVTTYASAGSIRSSPARSRRIARCRVTPRAHQRATRCSSRRRPARPSSRIASSGAPSQKPIPTAARTCVRRSGTLTRPSRRVGIAGEATRCPGAPSTPRVSASRPSPHRASRRLPRPSWCLDLTTTYTRPRGAARSGHGCQHRPEETRVTDGHAARAHVSLDEKLAEAAVPTTADPGASRRDETGSGGWRSPVVEALARSTCSSTRRAPAGSSRPACWSASSATSTWRPSIGTRTRRSCTRWARCC